MPARQGQLIAACALGLLLCGCGAMINGAFAKVTLVRAAPDHDYRVNGDRVARNVTTVIVPNGQPTTFKVTAPDGTWAETTTTTKVSALVIVLDVLVSLTIIGIAAPISDGLLGTFSYTEPTTIALVPHTAPLVAPSAASATSATAGEWVDLFFALETVAPPATGIPAAGPHAPSPSRSGESKKPPAKKKRAP